MRGLDSVTVLRPGFGYVLLVGLLAGIYHPVVVRCYAMADDYPYLWVLTSHQYHYFHWLSAMGRPLYEWLSRILYGSVLTICHLGYIRALTLLATIMFGGQLYRWAMRHGWLPLDALCLTLLICTSSAFGVYLSWSVCFNIVFAAIAGFWAGELALHGLSAPAGWPARGTLLLALVLLIIGLMLYQPTAMMYWLAVGLATFAPAGRRRSYRVLVQLLVLFGAALGVYWIAYQVELRWLLTADPSLLAAAGRSQLASDITAKLVFFGRSLLLSASIGQFTPVAGIALGVLVVALLGLLVQWWRERDARLPLLWLGLLPLGYLPNLIVAQNALLARILGVPSAMLAVYLCFGLYVLLRGHRHLRGSMLLLLAGYSAVAVYHNIDRYLIDLHQTERAIIVQALRRHYAPTSAAVAIVRPPHVNLVAGVPPSMEYGMPDTALSNAYARVIVQQLFSEVFHTRHLPRVIQCQVPARTHCPAVRQHGALYLIDIASVLAQRWSASGPQ